MNGIEKIKARIAADSEAEVAAIRRESDMECARIRAEYEKKAAERYEELLKEGLDANEQRASSVERTAKLDARKGLLGLKQDMVTEAFTMAREGIIGLPEAQYVEFLATVAAKSVVTGDEDIVLNAKDRSAVGSKVQSLANEKLKARGISGKLGLSAEAGDISGGLLLKQGDIGVNCSVDTLLELSRSELAAQVAELLFEG